MAIFNSSNPTLSEKIFSKSLAQPGDGVMTVRGSMQKFGFLMLLVVAGAAWTWKLYYSFKVPTMMGFMIAGFVGGFICALICTFSPKASKYVSPLYAILEGFALGGISAFFNDMFKAKYPNIIMEAEIGRAHV